MELNYNLCIQNKYKFQMHNFVLCLEPLLQTPCLTFLDARNCDLNERVIPIIGRSLRMGCFLTTIHLENTLISGRAMVILGKFSMKTCP